MVTVVDGCRYKDQDDPGNLEFDWMDVQLGLFRDRGMKVNLTKYSWLSKIDLLQVWMVGHVPPSASNYFPECVSSRCWSNYAIMLTDYR